MATYLEKKLYRSRLPIVDGGAEQPVQRALEKGKGVLRGFPRFVSRQFCGAGKNLRLHDPDYLPEGPDGPKTDERWFFYDGEADTGNQTRYPQFFREGQAHIITPDGEVVALRHAIEAAPKLIIGERYLNASGAKMPWYDKYFDNSGELGHHVHPEKDEAYWFDPDMNKRYNLTLYTSVGFYPWVTRKDVADGLRRWDETFPGGGLKDNGVRNLAPGMPIRMGTGFCMPKRVPHGPAGVCTREPQRPFDDYRFLQRLTSDGPYDRSLMNRHVPQEHIDDADWIANDLDWETSQDPHFVAKHMCLPILVPELSGDGVTEHWVIYRLCNGKQYFSARRTVIGPGRSVTLRDPSMSIVHFTRGRGTINGLTVKALDEGEHHIGNEVDDEFLITESALADGVEIVNGGEEDLILTRSFGPDAWDKLPS